MEKKKLKKNKELAAVWAQNKFNELFRKKFNKVLDKLDVINDKVLDEILLNTNLDCKLHSFDNESVFLFFTFENENEEIFSLGKTNSNANPISIEDIAEEIKSNNNVWILTSRIVKQLPKEERFNWIIVDKLSGAYVSVNSNNYYEFGQAHFLLCDEKEDEEENGHLKKWSVEFDEYEEYVKTLSMETVNCIYKDAWGSDIPGYNQEEWNKPVEKDKSGLTHIRKNK